MAISIMNYLIEKLITCPYCGEDIEVLLDITDINHHYIEDCQVCCKPITFLITENCNDEPTISVYSEDESF